MCPDTHSYIYLHTTQTEIKEQTYTAINITFMPGNEKRSVEENLKTVN
jgi:hypothetical protein